ncbi:MAG: ABC transporter ATP-binding protein [Pseudolabrys sp.]|jgi:branched-chain amino acid transport system ATP-binding protein
MTGTPLLQVRQLEVVYNRVATAIQGVSLDVPDGSIVALVGTNGAGKTTTLRAISGFLPSEDVAITDGEIALRGERINGRMPHQLAKAGIILVPERDKVFATLSVQDNLAFAAREGAAITIERIHGYFPRLRERSAQLAGYLSGGEKQMLAIGMALLCRPTLLLIDELSLGLAPIAIKELMGRLQQISREMHLTVLLVEQNAKAALSIADLGYVMESGRVVFTGTGPELLSHPDVREFYLGGAGQAENKSYRNIKQYRRKRRWWG